MVSLIPHGPYRGEVKIESETVPSPLETPQVSGYKRGQSDHFKVSFHLKIANGILDVMASHDKVLNRSTAITYETFEKFFIFYHRKPLFQRQL